uniref:FAST kinase leucine-rich domain-containing protein n=1 Tax=Clastoptera arizonana TaxID=38151 RepID=A0A1B6CUF4_9HEMI
MLSPESSSMSNGEVTNSPQFRILANTLRSQIKHLEINELIDALKFLGYIGIPATSKITQEILHLLSKHVNELSLQQITFLDFVMKDFVKTPLVTALKIALPIVFEAHLISTCDLENVIQLGDLLKFVSRRPIHEKCTRHIIEALTEQRKMIDFKLAKSIIRSLCDLKRKVQYDEILLHHSLDVLTDSINDLSFHEIDFVLTQVLSKYTLGYDYFYHEEFLNACSRYIIEKQCSFEHGIWTLKKLCRFNHVNISLLDYLTSSLLKNPWFLEQGSVGVLIGFLSGLAQADYKPNNWNLIIDLVIKCALGHQNHQELPWLKIVLDMCVMDCWSQTLFEKVFDEEFLDKYLSRDYNTLDKLQLLMLYQCTQTLVPWSSSIQPPSKYLKSAIEINGTHHLSFPLLNTIAHGLGDHSYVLSGVYTKHGHFLEHVVVMRKGGFPVAINLNGDTTPFPTTQRKYVENLDLPPDCTIVALMLLSSSMSSINNDRIRGTVRLQVNTIEAMGIVVVPILQTTWMNIGESEKIPYLMQAIQHKINNHQATSVIAPV